MVEVLYVFSYYRMCSLTTECVLLLQNVFSYYRMCSLTLQGRSPPTAMIVMEVLSALYILGLVVLTAVASRKDTEFQAHLFYFCLFLSKKTI